MCKHAALAVTALLLAGMPAAAGPLRWTGELTQAQAVARAQHSFAARLAALDAQAAAAQADSARSQTLPHLSISENYDNGSPQRLGMPTPFQRYTALDVSVPIFSPQLWSAARSAGLESDAARANAAMGVNEAVTQALQQYDSAALATAIVQQRAADVRDQQAHLSQTEDRVRAGADPRYLIARDRAALARACQSEEDAKADAARTIHALDVSLDFDMNSTLVVRLSPPATPLTTDAAQLEKRAESRPDVVAAERIVHAAHEGVLRAAAGYLPAISLTAQAYNGTSNPPMGESGTQVGLVASVPLFDGGSRSADVRTALYRYERAQLLSEKIRLQAQADVLDALRDLRAAQQNLRSAHSELRNSQVTLRIAQLRERAGKGIELETLDALASLASAREDVLRATARYDDAMVGLHRALGDYAS